MNKTIIILGTLAFTALIGSIVFFANEGSFFRKSHFCTRDHFDSFKKTHQKSYESPMEEEKRFNIYCENKQIVADLQKEHGAVFGETSLMDMSAAEFKHFHASNNIYIPKKKDNLDEIHNKKREGKLESTTVAASVDWRGKGVTPIKNQGRCGSCWTFSTTAAVEAALAIKKGQKNLDLSEQQVLDCTTQSHGCRGGYPNYAFSQMATNGMTDERSYPYRGVKGSCRRGGNYKISSYQDIRRNNVQQLLEAVNRQPVAVCINANNWQHYKSGILPNCQRNINHAVLLVGYDAKSYLIKNSWGTGWGEHGFIRIPRGQNNECDIAYHANYPVVGTNNGGGNCVDKNSNCPGWKRYCTDNRYFAFMSSNCKKTCGKC
jgi:C1A family cysteine protease